MSKQTDDPRKIILSTVRPNSFLLEAEDLLGAAEGLTSGRWQIFGPIAVAERPLAGIISKRRDHPGSAASAFVRWTVPSGCSGGAYNE
jgi:hypothetical protein